MKIQTGRFGEISVEDNAILTLPSGVIGFPDLKKYSLIDPGDESLILWLQSLEEPALAFPVLEPRFFKSDYLVRLSAMELRELGLSSIRDAAVFNILTIRDKVQDMTANLKAPIVINLKNSIAKQVVLQENEYPIRFPMFLELKKHFLTLKHSRSAQNHELPMQTVVSVDQLVPWDKVSETALA